jgi:Lrp/AsnC family transcriptional regulator of lysine biosynthesis
MNITIFVVDYLDEKDYQILDILRSDSRTSNISMAKQVNLTEGAVRSRIKRLIQDGTIRKFTIDTEHDRAEAIVLIKTQIKASKEILKRVRKHSNRLFETSGEYDVAAFLVEESMEKINASIDKLRAVSGVISTITLIKLADEQLLS